MTQAIFVVNPASGGGRTRTRWPRVAAAARQRGIEADVRLTAGPGDATRLTREALADGERLIVAVGGDGTVSEVVNGFLDGDAPLAPDAELAIVSSGSGGDLARTLAIPTAIEPALDVVARGHARPVDLGRVRFSDPAGAPAERLFVNIASTGMTAIAADRVNRAPKRLGGTPAYAWGAVAAFVAHRSRPVRIAVDGEVRELRCNSVVAANCRYFGGGMKITPEADPTDGLLDVLVIADIGVVDLALNLPRLYRGTHLPHPKLELLRGRHVTVEPAPGEAPFAVEADGEQPGTTPASFDVVPAAIRVRLPA